MKISSPEKPDFISPVQKTARVIIALLFLLIIYSLLNPLPMAAQRIHRYNGTYAYQEPHWTLSSEGEILEENVTLPSFRVLETGKKYRLSCVLTYDGRKDPAPYAFFYTHHMHCSAYLDGEELFSYDPGDTKRPDRSRSPGNIYTAVSLPEDTVGREFSIVFSPPLDSYIDFELPNTSFGDYATTAYYTYIGDMPHNILIILSAFLGITAILFSSLVLSGSSYREGMCIGTFALLFSLYNLTESTFNFYIISNPYLTYLFNYIAFSTMPIFLVAFLRERLDGRSKNLCAAIIMVGVILVVTEFYLHFTGVMDMREFLPILHIWYFAELFLIIGMLLLSKNKKNTRVLVIQLLPILAGMVLDAASYYQHWNIGQSDAPFSSIGVMIFLVAEIHHVWKSSIEIYTQSIHSQDYLQMAYIDSLTGIGNRRAFEDFRIRILAGEILHESSAVVSADLNNLKQANDNLGHAAGDYLIRSTANLLSDMAEGCGHVFRVGGDEFLLIVHDLTPQQLESRIESVREAAERLNSNSEVKLSLAFGYEYFKAPDLDAAMTRADKKMYHDKARIKSILHIVGR